MLAFLDTPDTWISRSVSLSNPYMQSYAQKIIKGGKSYTYLIWILEQTCHFCVHDIEVCASPERKRLASDNLVAFSDFVE